MNLQRDKSGQALLEFAFVLPMLCIFLLGVVDYGFAIYQAEVITNLAGEGSSLASRSDATNIQAAANTVMIDSDLNMTTYGCAIVTSITSPSAGTYKITNQVKSSPCNITASSKIGCYSTTGGCSGNNATVPQGVQQALTGGVSGATIYGTEVFYNYNYITSIGSLLHGTGTLPSQLYAAAYY